MEKHKTVNNQTLVNIFGKAELFCESYHYDSIKRYEFVSKEQIDKDFDYIQKKRIETISRYSKFSLN